MSDGKIHDMASNVEAQPDEVIVRCPDGYVVSLTPEAAVKTGEKLIDAAATAKGEARFQADSHKRNGRGANP